MSRRVRTVGDAARRDIFHWHKALHASGDRFPSRQEILARGAEMEAIVYHMSVTNVLALTDGEALEILRFESSVDGSRPGPVWARQLLQEDADEDVFFSVEEAKSSAKGGRPKADWTEDLWFACFREMFHNRNFSTLLELRDFMETYLTDREIPYADSTIKAKAAEFWRRCGLDENP